MRCFSSRALRGAALALLLALPGAGCSPGRPLAAAPLKLFFTCDTDGRLEPCGCFTGQNGGLSRLKSFLAAQAAENPLLVDIGDALEGPADYQILKYRHMQQAFAGMHYAALNVGGREARLSAAQLRELAAKAPVPMISANLLDAATGQPLFAPYCLVQRGGFRIALVGVLGAGRNDEAPGDGLAVEPMETALAKLLPALHGKADLVVLMAFADEAGLTGLARRFYECDLILGGKVRQPSQHLEKENRSIVLYTTNESKAVGVLDAQIAGPAQLVPRNFDIAFLDENIPQDPALLRESQEYRAEVRQAKLQVDDPGRLRPDEVPGVHPASTYVGSAACAACHARAAQVWAETPHAHAFESLLARQSDADPSCIACHTVGFGTESGYRRAYAGQKLAGVGCESCHGPGSEHVAQRQAGEKVYFKYRPLGAADCTACHRGEFSRPFNWETFWPAIQHGREAPVALR